MNEKASKKKKAVTKVGLFLFRLARLNGSERMDGWMDGQGRGKKVMNGPCGDG